MQVHGLPVEADLAGRLLVTGRFGGRIFEPPDVGPGPERAVGLPTLTAASQVELRLRVGFLNLAPYFVSWQHLDAIQRLSGLPEMTPYRVGGAYDRPLPRRIVEEAGVPREAFGQVKRMGATQNVFHAHDLTSASRRDFEAAYDQYDLLILDAYSSDAPPLHLITQEALRLYLDKLAPGGIVVFNISNRHMDFEPVLGNLARAAGLVAAVQDDPVVDDVEYALGKRPSQWVVMARAVAHLAPLAGDGRWKLARVDPAAPVWTDDFSALVRTFRWPRPRSG